MQEAGNLIGDPTNAVFSTAVLTEWINFAIADISQHFPRVITRTMNCVTDQLEYDLDDTFMACLSVEYPDGEDPPRFLMRREYTHPLFYEQPGFYDIINTQSALATNLPRLVISEAPTTGEDIVMEHTAPHNSLSAPNDVTTLFNRHTHLISLFVRWKAWQELATTEGMDPDPVKLLAATQEVNAYRAERAYYDALRRDIAAESASGRASGWRMDKYDSTY
jgi:hypothetical protein